MDAYTQLEKDSKLWSKLRKAGYSKTEAEKRIAASHRKNKPKPKRRRSNPYGISFRFI